MARLLHLIRHGAISDDACRRYYGSGSDLPLTQTGEHQARALQAVVTRLSSADRLLCSPMLRTRRTAELAFPQRHAEFENAVREIDFGHWEGRTFADIQAADAPAVEQWSCNEAAFCFPGGESIRGFRQRLELFSNSLHDAPGETLAIVTHGGVIRTLLCALLRLPASAYLVFDIPLASVTSIRLYESGGVLRSITPAVWEVGEWEG